MRAEAGVGDVREMSFSFARGNSIPDELRSAEAVEGIITHPHRHAQQTAQMPIRIN